MERWPSGLRHSPGKTAYGKPYREFESLPLRGNLRPRLSGVFNFHGNDRCDTNCLVSQRFERRSDVFVCARKSYLCAQGKNREPGLQAFCVSKRTGRSSSPSPCFFFAKQFLSLLPAPSDTSGSALSQYTLSRRRLERNCFSLKKPLLAKSRACAHSIPPALAPRINAFLFEKIRRLSLY